MNKKHDLSPEQIEAAVQAGIISKAQAQAMRGNSHLKNVEDAALIGNEDDMRFVRSFSDVFISIGIGLLVIGLFGFCGMMGGGIAYLLGAASLWVMAEYFGKKKRAHLPTLLIALAFLVFVLNGFKDVLNSTGRIDVFPAFVTLGAMLLFYWRFKLPFSVALIALSLLILAFSFIGGVVPLGIFLLVSGLALFAVALYYDARDTDRLTRFADNAFWLHFTAAPLILHGIMMLFVKSQAADLTSLVAFVQSGNTNSVIMLAIVGVLSVVGLAINRRALIVSSLGYAGFAIFMLLKGDGFSMANIGSILFLTLLFLGGSIVFLGVGWHATRRALLAVLPSSGMFGKIFPPVRE
ncbi:MAG: hypothetical protein EX271_00365 [Acidimicrobiales bacterium]|nr:hypothetical protein [Hyphomonadaceae bacterium]RZV45033.1 MAG: hypothetical protein EX271_00365 [Acidimicrobiales bacterium]